MHTHAIDPTTEGPCCNRGEGYDLRTVWRAMTAYIEGEPRGGGHRRHRGSGGPGSRGGPGGFPFAGFGGPARPGGPWRGGGRKARRGDIRTAALLLLAEEPRNGYQIMQEVEERSDGAWRPSPGSVYPALQQLEDEGLVRSEEIDGRKAFQLTDAGRALLAERDPERPAPWEEMSGGFSPPSSSSARSCARSPSPSHRSCAAARPSSRRPARCLSTPGASCTASWPTARTPSPDRGS